MIYFIRTPWHVYLSFFFAKLSTYLQWRSASSRAPKFIPRRQQQHARSHFQLFHSLNARKHMNSNASLTLS
jgi:hypothetical protein